jgi:hypothetical protein
MRKDYADKGAGVNHGQAVDAMLALKAAKTDAMV